MKQWIYSCCMGVLLVACNNRQQTGDKQHNDSAAVYLTTPDQQQLLAQQSGLGGVKDTAVINIRMDSSRQFQEIEGFGAAMTGSSAYVMQRYMSPGQRQALLEDLFGTEKGIGINYIRMSIGASDFSTSPYSYDDMPGGQRDDSLKHFSIEHDTQEVVPVLKQVVAVNPGIHIMGSPWSAPGWMKTSGKLEGGSLRPDAYEVYARYFVKYIRAFGEAGIKITALTVQNEPQYEAFYPTMKMTAPEQGTFIKDHLGPLLEKEGLSEQTKIMLFDHNWNSPEYPISILDDSLIARYTAGAAFHCYEGAVGAMTKVHDAHPEKGLYFTECSGGSWSPVFADNLQYMVRQLLIGTINNWSKNVLLWNMALDEKNGPTTNQPGTGEGNRGCMTCRGVVTVNSKDGAVTRNVEYYALAHFSKFVRPGAKRIYSSALVDKGVENVAFLNTDGSRVMVVINTTQQERAFSVSEQRDVYRYVLKPGAVATLVWR
ncbi:glycoside hydrolase family 30 beta sandwich domain-containing protein [Chitinophaga sp. CF418]|uniref:glycoside hydrolase family 30 protein n=1 Tax=Chitinophaga sp. CF418 TaxID=1855287 RepID=UPI000910B0F3|nr:glycoside hydrolase family 30 beta sandwich domain-containing protein [Chitinophaga sp. CF418]SHN25650.1 glucosylceramidase [Chitinophaga sp. CF418]